MNRNRMPIALVLLTLLALTPALAADKWLHVKIEEDGSRGDKVHVNVPLEVVERMLPLIDVDELHGGRLHLGIDEVDDLDLREVAAALRDAPEAEYVTIQSGNDSLRVAKEDDFIVVRIEEGGGHSSDKVRIRLPLAVIDALVGDDADQLDLAAALRLLGQYDSEPIVDIEADDTTIKVWIDSKESGS